MFNLKNEIMEVLTNWENELNNNNAIRIGDFDWKINNIINRYPSFTNFQENEYGQQDVTCEISFCDSEQPEHEDFSFMIELRDSEYVTHVYLTK